MTIEEKVTEVLEKYIIERIKILSSSSYIPSLQAPSIDYAVQHCKNSLNKILGIKISIPYIPHPRSSATTYTEYATAIYQQLEFYPYEIVYPIIKEADEVECLTSKESFIRNIKQIQLDKGEI